MITAFDHSENLLKEWCRDFQCYYLLNNFPDPVTPNKNQTEWAGKGASPIKALDALDARVRKAVGSNQILALRYLPDIIETDAKNYDEKFVAWASGYVHDAKDVIGLHVGEDLRIRLREEEGR